MELESIKISKDVANKVRLHKEKTGISIKVFIEKAINEKFTRLKSKKKQ